MGLVGSSPRAHAAVTSRVASGVPVGGRCWAAAQASAVVFRDHFTQGVGAPGPVEVQSLHPGDEGARVDALRGEFGESGFGAFPLRGKGQRGGQR